MSVEAGVGLHGQYKKELGRGIVNFNAGMMFYREFADPYNIRLGMNGMNGTFNLYDERSVYRSVYSLGFGYDMDDLNLYGEVQHYSGTDAYAKAKVGAKIAF